MASVTPRGDKFLAQVRINQGGALIFSESKVFDTKAQAVSWGDRLEAKVKHLIDYASRRKTEDGVVPATIKSDLSLLSAAHHRDLRQPLAQDRPKAA